MKCLFHHVTADLVDALSSSIVYPAQFHPILQELSFTCLLEEASEIRSNLDRVIGSHPHIWFSLLLPKPSVNASPPFAEKTTHVLFGFLFSNGEYRLHCTPFSDEMIWSMTCSKNGTLLMECQEIENSQAAIQMTVPIKSIQEKILVVDNGHSSDVILSLNSVISNVRQRTDKWFNQ